MIYFLIAALIVAGDQYMKHAMTLLLNPLGAHTPEAVRTQPLIPGLIRLNYFENKGAGLSLFADMNMRWPLVAVSAVTAAVIAAVLIRYRARLGTIGKLSLAAVLGGAVANLIDRALFGYVVDFFEFEFVRFAVFNVADVFITVGGIVFCIWYICQPSAGVGGAKKRRGPQAAPADGPAEVGGDAGPDGEFDGGEDGSGGGDDSPDGPENPHEA